MEAGKITKDVISKTVIFRIHLIRIIFLFIMNDQSSKRSIIKYINRKAVDEIVQKGNIIYGITTGFGKFSDVLIQKEHVKDLQHKLIHSHACGVGEMFPEVVSRAMLILRANALLKGYSGVRPVVIETLLELINHQIHPIVPSQGSLGASGDLAPLSHLALVLMGEGEVIYNGKKEAVHFALSAAKIKPITLEAKEGNNGEKVISGGNFHGQPIALAMDFLKIAIAEIASISERRIERLVNPQAP